MRRASLARQVGSIVQLLLEMQETECFAELRDEDAGQQGEQQQRQHPTDWLTQVRRFELFGRSRHQADRKIHQHKHQHHRCGQFDDGGHHAVGLLDH